MKQQPQQQPPNSPLLEKELAFAKWFVQFPSLTVLVFLRQDLGYRLVNPLVLLAANGLLAMFAMLIAPNHEAARPTDLALFAMLSFAMGVVQRIRRWREMNKGIPQHSYYIGTSPFESRQLPKFCRRNRRIARFIDPVVCGYIGYLLIPFSRLLGLYLVFSALCLRALEYLVFQKHRNRDLDMVDDLIVSQVQAEVIEQFAPAPTAQQKSDTGIPTGLGDDIRPSVPVSPIGMKPNSLAKTRQRKLTNLWITYWIITALFADAAQLYIFFQSSVFAVRFMLPAAFGLLYLCALWKFFGFDWIIAPAAILEAVPVVSLSPLLTATTAWLIWKRKKADRLFP